MGQSGSDLMFVGECAHVSVSYSLKSLHRGSQPRLTTCVRVGGRGRACQCLLLLRIGKVKVCALRKSKAHGGGDMFLLCS